MTSICTTLFITAVIIASNVTCFGQSESRPIIPFNTNFWNYWDHYWTTWLHDHPKYEAIELTTFDNPSSEYKLIRVFLSEKSGNKLQYFYLNDQDAVDRSRANAYFRDITYRRSGKAGEPQSLYLRFEDKDNHVIEWTIEFDPNQKMVKHDGGLTSSIHSVGYVLLYHLRTRKADSRKDKVLVDGKDYAFSDDENAEGKRSWYNSDTYSSVIVFGDSSFQFDPDAIRNSWGRTFTRSKENKLRWMSNDLSRSNFIEFEVDKLEQITEYSHTSFGRRFTFSFDPALPSTTTVKDGQVISFAVSFDDYKRLMTGKIHVSRTQNEILLKWKPDHPDWARTRSFISGITLDQNGYGLKSRELKQP